MKDGFITYVRTFTTLLDAHHRTEDEMAFPYLREVIQSAPFEELEKEHKVVEAILPQIHFALKKIESGTEEAQALQHLVTLLTDLIVPFLLYNLEKDERDALSKFLPEVVTQQLVPVVWKAKWQPMVPFLLS